MKQVTFALCIAAALRAQTPPPPVGAPPTPANQPATGQPAVAPRPDGEYAIFNTSMGTITVQLFEKETPVTVRNFVALARGTKAWKDPKSGAMVAKPLYNGIGFHRVAQGQMIQGGDPTGLGNHDCGFKIKDEILPDIKFDRPGRLAMANIGQKNSGACQWFITEMAGPAWDGDYTIFGQVIDGQDVVTKISHVPTRGDHPINPPKLISVKIERVGPPPVAPAAVKKAVTVKK
jgi:peptidyl-prolyl cis-trans isomerase A (cyclophilin A)